MVNILQDNGDRKVNETYGMGSYPVLDMTAMLDGTPLKVYSERKKDMLEGLPSWLRMKVFDVRPNRNEFLVIDRRDKKEKWYKVTGNESRLKEDYGTMSLSWLKV